MLNALLEWIKSLFAGKGTMQIGQGNQAVSDVTTGHVVGPVAVGTGNVINYHAPAETKPKTTRFEPTPAEVEILRLLADSPTGYLNSIRYDGGYAVVVGGKTLGGPAHPEANVQVHEAVQRLLSHGLLADIQHNGEILHLSSQGRDAALQIREQVAKGERPDFAELERLMPELLGEMRQDYTQSPLIREIIVLDTEGNEYIGGSVFAYHRSKHPDLDSKLQILQNHELIENITFNNPDRYRVKEGFARYLCSN